MINVINASKKFKHYTVLSNINYKFHEKKAYGIIGVNGSGKTMLLKAICGFIVLDEGEIMQDGTKIRDKYNLIDNAGIVFNEFSMVGHKSILDNLLDLARIKNVVTKNVIIEYLNKFSMMEFADKLFSQVSLGTKKKAIIIQALMDNPTILILDEPFNALDEKSAEIFREYLIKFKEHGTIIITSHNSQDIDMICDEVIKIEGGCIYEKR